MKQLVYGLLLLPFTLMGCATPDPLPWVKGEVRSIYEYQEKTPVDYVYGGSSLVVLDRDEEGNLNLRSLNIPTGQWKTLEADLSGHHHKLLMDDGDLLVHESKGWWEMYDLSTGKSAGIERQKKDRELRILSNDFWGCYKNKKNKLCIHNTQGEKVSHIELESPLVQAFAIGQTLYTIQGLEVIRYHIPSGALTDRTVLCDQEIFTKGIFMPDEQVAAHPVRLKTPADADYLAFELPIYYQGCLRHRSAVMLTDLHLKPLAVRWVYDPNPDYEVAVCDPLLFIKNGEYWRQTFLWTGKTTGSIKLKEGMQEFGITHNAPVIAHYMPSRDGVQILVRTPGRCDHWVLWLESVCRKNDWREGTLKLHIADNALLLLNDSPEHSKLGITIVVLDK